MLFLPNDVKRFLFDYTRASTYYAFSRTSRNIYSALTTKQYSKRSIHRFLRVINERPPSFRYTNIYYDRYAVTPAGWLYGWIDEYFDCLNPVLKHSEYTQLGSSEVTYKRDYGEESHDSFWLNSGQDEIIRSWSSSGELTRLIHWRGNANSATDQGGQKYQREVMLYSYHVLSGVKYEMPYKEGEKDCILKDVDISKLTIPTGSATLADRR